MGIVDGKAERAPPLQATIEDRDRIVAIMTKQPPEAGGPRATHVVIAHNLRVLVDSGLPQESHEGPWNGQGVSSLATRPDRPSEVPVNVGVNRSRNSSLAKFAGPPFGVPKVMAAVEDDPARVLQVLKRRLTTDQGGVDFLHARELPGPFKAWPRGLATLWATCKPHDEAGGATVTVPVTGCKSSLS